MVTSSSPYGHPILFVEKMGGGSWRMCINYRILYSNTLNDSGPLPYIDNLLAHLYGAKFFQNLIYTTDTTRSLPIFPVVTK